MNNAVEVKAVEMAKRNRAARDLCVVEEQRSDKVERPRYFPQFERAL